MHGVLGAEVGQGSLQKALLLAEAPGWVALPLHIYWGASPAGGRGGHVRPGVATRGTVVFTLQARLVENGLPEVCFEFLLKDRPTSS